MVFVISCGKFFFVPQKKGGKAMKKMKLITVIGLSVVTLNLSPVNSEAAEGGWVEDQGNWVMQDEQKVFKSSGEKDIAKGTSLQFATASASSSPEKHYATFKKYTHSSYVGERVTAHTEWDEVYHYSRARYEGFHGVEGDSGRVWGNDVTAATSGEVDPAFTKAHTYWGN